MIRCAVQSSGAHGLFRLVESIRENVARYIRMRQCLHTVRRCAESLSFRQLWCRFIRAGMGEERSAAGVCAIPVDLFIADLPVRKTWQSACPPAIWLVEHAGIGVGTV